MAKGDVQRVSVMIEIDDVVYIVALPQDRLQLLVKMAEGLSDNGKLPVKRAPDDYKFEEIRVDGKKPKAA